MRHRKPMNPVSSECETGHIKRSRISEDVEPCEANQEENACDELHEARHPKAPHSHTLVHFRAGSGKAEQRLAAPNEIAGAKAEEAYSDRRKRRRCEGDCLCNHVSVTPGGRIDTTFSEKPACCQEDIAGQHEFPLTPLAAVYSTRAQIHCSRGPAYQPAHPLVPILL